MCPERLAVNEWTTVTDLVVANPPFVTALLEKVGEEFVELFVAE